MGDPLNKLFGKGQERNILSKTLVVEYQKTVSIFGSPQVLGHSKGVIHRRLISSGDPNWGMREKELKTKIRI